MLLHHHKERLSEILGILDEQDALTAYNIAGNMMWRINANSWEEFPALQKIHAINETFAHLDYLIEEKKLLRENINGNLVYRLARKD